MDPFAALLAKQSGAAEEAEDDGDPFNALLKGRAKPGAPPAKSGEIPSAPLYEAPPKVEQEPSTLGRLMRGKGVVETGADALDIVLGGLPAMILGTIGEVTQRASSVFDGRGYREGAKAGAEFSRSMGEKFGRPIYDNLVAAGVIDQKSRSIPMQAMDKVGGWLEHGATVAEHDSGGLISKEDYLASINGFMAAMGVKGFQAGAARWTGKKGEARAASAWDAALERYNAEEQLARERFEAGAANRAAAESVARPGVDSLYGGNFAAEAAARKEAFLKRKAREKGIADFPPSGERTGSRDGIPLNLEGKETPTSQPGNQPFHTADTAAALKRGIVVDTPIETQGRLSPAGQTSLDSGLAKVREGRLFDMTAEERLAVRGSREITDPKIITAAAVGATGLGLAMLYEPSPEEAAMAIGAGALLRRGGKGETLREIMAYPDATPLGAMLEPSAYTTRTIERLADASPGRFEFSKAQIEQLLKQSDVTAHERGIMREVLDSVPRDTITAKELMVGLRTAVKDFELGPKVTDLYGQYGLDNIGREAVNPELAEEFGLPRNTDELSAVSRVYRSPLRFDVPNHYQEPNYFAHTRSFMEDGVRHVIELQSDLAQKPGKLLTPEAREQARAEVVRLDRLDKEYPELVSGAFDELLTKQTELQKKGLDATSPEWQEAVRNHSRKVVALDEEREGLRGKSREVRQTLERDWTAQAREPVAPMLKDWHKRLIREELADAARNLERGVRFATADTVAKVEGWPFENDPRQAARYYQEEIAKLQEEIRAYTQLRDTGETGGHPYLDALRVADPESYARVREGASAELRAFEANLAEAQRKLKNAEAYAERPPRLQYPEHQGIYDRYKKDVEKFLRQLGAKPYTDSAGHTWLEVPLGEQQKALPGGGARTQIGGVDPALLKGVAAVGGTATLAWLLSADKDKARHAAMAGILTGLGILAKSRVPAIGKMIEQAVNGAQRLAGNLSTDSAVTAPLLRRLTEHARAELKEIHDAGRAVSPFLEIASKLPATVQKDLNVALMNGNSAGIVAAVGKAAAPGLLKEWNNVQAQLKKFGAELQSVGLLKELRPDYFPRIVKDLPGLLNAIGKDYAVPLQKALDAAVKKAGHPLDEAERAAVINQFIEKNLRGQTGQGKASFFKRRTIDNVSIDLEPFYVEPLQALPLYIGSAVRAIERARFFGRDAVRDPVTGKLDLSASIGNVVGKEIEAGNLTPENFTRLTNVLQTRFGPAYESPARPLQTIGQLTNIALLGNVFSGMMNLADVGTIAAQHGVIPLAAAIAAKVGKRQKITAADVGMAEHIMEEFVYGTRDPVKLRIPLTERTAQVSMAKALDATFKWSGFKAFDQAMKEVALNAAFEKYARLSRTKAGEARILRQYSDYFTTDMPQLLADLRAGAKTKLTTELAFRELSDAQPVTKVEMPQFYLDHPNLRFGFALKSFMIKQINLIKRRGVREIERGNFREGVGFLTRYTLMAGAAGATMDWVVKSLLGRDSDLEWKNIPFNAMKNFGLSEYVIDKMRQGKGKEALLAATTPPVDPVLKILSADPEAVRYFPLVGRLFYDRAMDGAEKANAAKKLAEKKKRRDAERTPEERRDLEERTRERRKRLLEEQ